MGYCGSNSLNCKKWCKKVSGHQAAIMEVLGMADEKEEKYWQYIIAFAALIFAIYPIGKDWITDQNDTFRALIFTLLFIVLLYILLVCGWHFYFKRK